MPPEQRPIPASSRLRPSPANASSAPPAASTTPPEGLAARVLELGEELRSEGVAVGTSGDVFYADPATSLTSWTATTGLDSSRTLNAVSCAVTATATLCAAVDASGHLITSTNPGTGSSWSSSPTLIDSGNVLSGLLLLLRTTY